jgi:hypothetical protein
MSEKRTLKKILFALLSRDFWAFSEISTKETYVEE